MPKAPRAGRRGTGRTWLIVVSMLVVLAASLAIDGPLARAVAKHPPAISPALLIMFRLAGYVPVWLIVAGALILVDAEAGWRRSWRRGASLIATVVLSGLAAEVLKIVVRRARPGAEGTYVFRSSGDGMFSSSGLGWPSSHAAVAFGAVWVLCFLFPRATSVWLIVGIGCGLTRIAVNDHFASDVVSAAIIAYLVAAGVRRLTTPRAETAD